MGKQTAVEWLHKELALNNNSIDSIKERIYRETEIWKQAKQMEKEQIMEAWIGTNTCDSAEQYYNETYGKDSND